MTQPHTSEPVGALVTTLKWVFVGAMAGGALVGLVWMGFSARQRRLTEVPKPVPSTTSLTDESQPRGSPLPKGKLGEPFGTLVTVRGIVFDEPRHAERGIPWLEVRTVDGTELEKPVSLPLSAYFGEWGRSDGRGVDKPVAGESIELRGYETGEFVGIPNDTYVFAGVELQSTGYHFRHQFRAIAGKAIPALNVSEPTGTPR